MKSVPAMTLNDGHTMPQLGFGVYKVPPDEAQQAVELALAAGYRSIDTARMYDNEEGVGAALSASGLPRSDVFLTTKLDNDAHGYDATLRAFDESLALLGLDYVDLYLIHWPQPTLDRYVDSWRAFEKLRADGLIHSIGVSNFQSNHLDRLMADTDVVPAVNQIELHPYFVQEHMRTFDAERGIRTEAWSPLARGGQLLVDPFVVGVAERYGRTPAQIVIRWHLQLGNIVIPKSTTPARIKENIDVFDFELAPQDVLVITELDRGERVGSHPDTVG